MWEVIETALRSPDNAQTRFVFKAICDYIELGYMKLEWLTTPNHSPAFGGKRPLDDLESLRQALYYIESGVAN